MQKQDARDTASRKRIAMSIKMDPDLMDWIEEKARESRRTSSGFVRFVLDVVRKREAETTASQG